MQERKGAYGAGAVAKTKTEVGKGPFTAAEVAKHNTEEVRARIINSIDCLQSRSSQRELPTTLRTTGLLADYR